MNDEERELFEKLKNDKSIAVVTDGIYLMTAAAVSDYLIKLYKKSDFYTLEEYFASQKSFFHIDGYDFYLGNFSSDYIDNYLVISNDNCLIGVRLCDGCDDKKLVIRLNYALKVAGVDLDESLLLDKAKYFIKKRELKLE